ncbi:hypothetical protein KY363_01755 [Candidatus Woesearchaeota archaeon]|nr:hypothetical protein [Candidatus Woesearchaeota archaeon]
MDEDYNNSILMERNRDHERKRLLAYSVACGLSIISLAGVYCVRDHLPRTAYELNVKYLHKYADTDNDGVITREERARFMSRVLEGKGVKYVEGLSSDLSDSIIDRDGDTVSSKNLVDWFREFAKMQEAAKACKPGR